MHGAPIVVGTIANRNGAGSGTTLLDATYRAGTLIAVTGIGAINLALTVGKDAANSISVRLMDYTDAANPRPLPTQDASLPAAPPSVEQTYAASTKTDLVANLGGVVGVIALEEKATGGAPTANDSAAAVLTMFDGGAR